MKGKLLIPVFALLAIIIIALVYLTRPRKNSVYGSGMIEVEEVLVSSQLAGKIADMRAIEGASVRTGDTLVIIEHRELTAQQKESRAGQVIAAQSLKEIEERQKELEKNVVRLRNLHATGDIPDNELENIETQYSVIKTQREKAMAGLKASQARVELIESQIANAYVLSPRSGVILAKNFNQGELVMPASPLLRIGDLKTSWLKIYLSEKDMGKALLGAHAHIFVDAYPRQTFEGRVTWIASEAEFTPKNIQTKDERAHLVFAVKITIPNEEQKLMPGMPADANIIEDGNH